MNCLNGCTVVLKRNVWHVSERPKPHFYLTRRSSRTVTACGQTSVCFLPPTCHYCRCLQSKRNSHTHTHMQSERWKTELYSISVAAVFFLVFFTTSGNCIQNHGSCSSCDVTNLHQSWCNSFIYVHYNCAWCPVDVEQWQLGKDLIQYCRVDVCSQWHGCLLIRAVCFLPVLSADNED